MRMVRAGWKPSLREASCWRREVTNGGVGWRRRSLRSTLTTVHVAPASPASTASTAAFVSRRNCLWSSLRPSTSASRATKGGGSRPSSSASTVQYSSGVKAWIARSRSQMMRTATDCTRPAESPRRTFFQRSGESW